MCATVKAKQEVGYLLLEAKGQVLDLNDYQRLTQLIAEEILRHDATKILMDATSLLLPPSLILQSDIVDFYDRALPPISHNWMLVCVPAEENLAPGEFWEHLCHQHGYNFHIARSYKEALGRFGNKTTENVKSPNDVLMEFMARFQRPSRFGYGIRPAV